MSINELAIKLRKNKIDLEYKTLLQEMNIILVSLIGFPITWIATVNFLELNSIFGNSGSILIFVIVIGAIVWFKEKIDNQLCKKREEINELLNDLHS